jgi:SpoVK/Ycf46/Vps4 family AAA+-type ATPase
MFLEKIINYNPDDEPEDDPEEREPTHTAHSMKENGEWINYRERNYSEEEMRFFEKFETTFPPATYDIQRDEIGGLEDILKKLDNFSMGINHGFLYEIMGIRPPKGFLLEGPPGSGKTLIAKYLSRSINARFVDLPLDMFESKWVGEASKNLRNYMEMCKRYHALIMQKVLIFFDEAEEAFKRRDEMGWHGPRVNVLLREMDGLGSSDGIIFGAATNHVSKVDPAIMRPGRLDYIITIPQYSPTAMGDVFRAISVGLNRKAKHHEPYQLTPEDNIVLGTIVHARQFTPADIYEIFRLTVERKIEYITTTKDTLIQKSASMVNKDDLLQTIQEYKIKEQPIKRIGYKQ